MAKISDIASDIFVNEMQEDSTLSIASIAQWLRTNLGNLNNLINTDYVVNSTTYEIVDSSGTEIGESETAILKKMFEIYFFKKSAKSYLGAASVDVRSIQQDGITVQLWDKNSYAKNYQELAKEARGELKQFLNNYKFSRSTACQVVGDDYLTQNGAPTIDPLNNTTLSS